MQQRREAGCYTGRSTTQAVATIRATTPDLVTLNETCQGDLAALHKRSPMPGPDAQVESVFAPALDRRTGQAYRCQNGQS